MIDLDNVEIEASYLADAKTTKKLIKKLIADGHCDSLEEAQHMMDCEHIGDTRNCLLIELDGLTHVFNRNA